jgi:hypothetical protein
MKGIKILVAEWFITGLIVYSGLSGKQILFFNGPRTAVITLGIIGFAMCMIMPTIGKFISNPFVVRVAFVQRRSNFCVEQQFLRNSRRSAKSDSIPDTVQQSAICSSFGRLRTRTDESALRPAGIGD